MIYPSILERKYNEYLPFIQETARQVKETFVSFCEDNGYAFSSRIKKIDSLAEKIETGRFACWTDLDDLFGCTVIVPTLLHEKKVIEFCKNIFSVDNTIKRGQICDNLLRLIPLEKRKEKTKEIIDAIQLEVKSISNDTMPRSISLFQYLFAVLVQKEIIEIPSSKYYAHITQEFDLLYSDIVDTNNKFTY